MGQIRKLSLSIEDSFYFELSVRQIQLAFVHPNEIFQRTDIIYERSHDQSRTIVCNFSQ